MSDEIERPANGYGIGVYYEMRQGVRELPEIIRRTRARIESQQAYLADRERQLAKMEATLAWMLEHQADEIAEVDAHRAKVIAALKGTQHD